MIKIMATQRAFFNGEIIKPGQILNIKSNTVPSWAKTIETCKTENKKNQNANKQEIQQQLLNQQNENEKNVEKNIPADLDLSNKTQEELNLILDDLTTKAIEKNIFLKDADKKTIIEQIQELNSEIEKADKKGE